VVALPKHPLSFSMDESGCSMFTLWWKKELAFGDSTVLVGVDGELSSLLAPKDPEAVFFSLVPLAGYTPYATGPTRTFCAMFILIVFFIEEKLRGLRGASFGKL